MSVSCTTSPTATSTIPVTTSFPTTDFVESVITADPTTSAIATSTTCLGFLTPSSGVATCTSTSTITELTTIPGGVSTTRIQVVTTVQSVTNRVTTLFGTSCTTIPNNGNGNGNSNSNGNGNGNNSSGGGGGGGGGNGNGNATSVSPTPVVITSQSETTLANGDVSTVMVTSTSTLPASTTFINPPPTLGSKDNQSSENKVNLGPVIGGSLGGFFALLLIALAIWLFIIKRRRRWDDIFEKSLNEPDSTGSVGYGDSKISHSSSGKLRARFSLGPDLEVEPRPYQYGIVGHSQNVSNQTNDAAPFMSRPSTAGSNYPLLSGHHTTPSNSSSQPHTPSYPPANTLTVAPSIPVSPSSHVPAQSTSNELQGYFGQRAGSPVSFTEGNRKLQVINGSPPSIYGGRSLHQRMMSDGSEPPPPPTPRNLSAINVYEDFVQTTGVDTTKGSGVKARKSSLPASPAGTSNVLIPNDGPPKLVLNL